MSFLKECGRDFHASVLVAKKAVTFLCRAEGAAEMLVPSEFW